MGNKGFVNKAKSGSKVLPQTMKRAGEKRKAKKLLFKKNDGRKK